MLRAVGDGSIAELDLVYPVDAIGAGVDNYLLCVQDTLADALAVLDGEPLPTYE